MSAPLVAAAGPMTTLSWPPLGAVTTFLGDMQPWWAEMVKEDNEKCEHTHNFFHWFLPHAFCPSQTRIAKRCPGTKAKWICLQALQVRPISWAPEARAASPCVIYSFGSSGATCFEEEFVKLNRLQHRTCEVHIFDPTSRSIVKHGWHYYGYGLGGRDPKENRYYNWRTQKEAYCPSCAMKTLKQTMASLSHSFVDVLKVDIDGAEWRSFEAIFDDFSNPDEPLPFGQLQIETTGLDITPQNASRIANFWRTLARRRFAAFHLETTLSTCRIRNKSQGTSTEFALINMHPAMSHRRANATATSR